MLVRLIFKENRIENGFHPDLKLILDTNLVQDHGLNSLELTILCPQAPSWLGMTQKPIW